MSLEHAILGFLNYKPLSGYDLKKIFDVSVHHFWPADQSQIYRTLARLGEKGFVEMEFIEQNDRPSRKVYHITPAGREELRTWLASPIAHHEHRSAPLVQVFFAGLLPDEKILPIFELAAENTRAVLQQYENIPQQIEVYKDTMQSEREFFFWMLTLEAGIREARASLALIEETIQRLRNGEIPQA